MAFKKNGEKEKGKKPTFVARCRQSADSDFFMTIGAAWEVEVNGQAGFSVKLQSMPVAWDGSFLLLTPKEAE